MDSHEKYSPDFDCSVADPRMVNVYRGCRIPDPTTTKKGVVSPFL